MGKLMKSKQPTQKRRNKIATTRTPKPFLGLQLTTSPFLEGFCVVVLGGTPARSCGGLCRDKAPCHTLLLYCNAALM